LGSKGAELFRAAESGALSNCETYRFYKPNSNMYKDTGDRGDISYSNIDK